MCNQTKSLFALLIIAFYVFTGCYYASTSVITIDHEYKTVDNAIKNVTSDLGMTEIKTEDSLAAYIRKNGNIGVYAMRPVTQAQSDSVTKLTLVAITKSKEVSDNLGKTFSSFVLQSIDSTYIAKNSEKFYRLEPKSMSEMYKLNWISPVIGIHYVGKNNPFVEKFDYVSGEIGFGLFDAIGLFATIGGPFLGKTSKDKLSISLTGIVELVFWRILVPETDGKRDLEEYNNIVNTKYSLPIEIKRE